MHTSTGLARAMRMLGAAGLLAASAGAPAQGHVKEFGDYTLRASSAGTQNLSAETAAAHGIERGPRRAVLNVTVLKKEKGAESTVRAAVTAQARNLSGHTRAIGMREVPTGDFVSYLGSYDFVHGEVLDFSISVRPVGSGETLNTSFRERMWGPGDLPDVPRQR